LIRNSTRVCVWPGVCPSSFYPLKHIRPIEWSGPNRQNCDEMGNQACGGGDRKDPKPSSKTSRRPNEDQQQIADAQERSRFSSRVDNGWENQSNPVQQNAFRGEKVLSARTPPLPQRQESERFSRNDVEGAYFPQGGVDGNQASTAQGPKSPNISLSYWASLQNEASALLMQDRNNESLAKFKEALKVQVAVLGERHPDIALTMNNLGIVSRACGRPEDSVGFFQKAVEICFEVQS